jgi:hypothetical protein
MEERKRKKKMMDEEHSRQASSTGLEKTSAERKMACLSTGK